jgi:anti-anti-sigma factor
MDTDNTEPVMSPDKVVDLIETAQELQYHFLQRMDTTHTAKVDTAFLEKLASSGGKKIVFDLEKVDYIDSSFLRLCVVASKAGPAKFVIVNVTPTVRKVLTIAGFENLAEII